MEFPFDLPQTPDSVIIDIQSSCWQDSLVSFVGSRLIIDEIQFKSQPLPNSIAINGDDEKELTIFPNPASKTIYLSNRKVDGYTEYKIYSISGTLVKSDRIYRDFQEIPVNDLGNGVYLFTVKSQSVIVSRKLIVLH